MFPIPWMLLNIYHPYGCHLKGRAIMQQQRVAWFFVSNFGCCWIFIILMDVIWRVEPLLYDDKELLGFFCFCFWGLLFMFSMDFANSSCWVELCLLVWVCHHFYFWAHQVSFFIPLSFFFEGLSPRGASNSRKHLF